MVVWFVICLGLSPAGFVFRGTLKVYHADRLRSVRLVTDGGQDIMVSCVYEGFGKIVGQEGGGGGSYQWCGLWGYRNDWDGGLMHVGARYYEVETGRWVQKDPWLGTIKNPQTLNRYIYVINNPIDFIDPSGRAIGVGGCVIIIGIFVTIGFFLYIAFKKIKEGLERQEKEGGVDVERVYEKQYKRRSVIK